jgi:hypothetical protein
MRAAAVQRIAHEPRARRPPLLAQCLHRSSRRRSGRRLYALVERSSRSLRLRQYHFKAFRIESRVTNEAPGDAAGTVVSSAHRQQKSREVSISRRFAGAPGRRPGSCKRGAPDRASAPHASEPAAYLDRATRASDGMHQATTLALCSICQSLGERNVARSIGRHPPTSDGARA